MWVVKRGNVHLRRKNVMEWIIRVLHRHVFYTCFERFLVDWDCTLDVKTRIKWWNNITVLVLNICLRVFSSKNTCLRLLDIVVFTFYTCFLVETSFGIKKKHGFLDLTWRGLKLAVYRCFFEKGQVRVWSAPARPELGSFLKNSRETHGFEGVKSIVLGFAPERAFF